LAIKDESYIQSPHEWEVLVVRDFEEIEAVRQTWEKMQAEEPYPRINADIDRYLATLKATSNSIEPYIIVLKENGWPAAMVIGWIGKDRLKCVIGRRALFKPALRQLSVIYGGVIGKKTEQISRVLVGELMKELRRGEVDVVFLNHLETDSSLYHVARKMPGLLCRGHFPKVEAHMCMSIPEGFDQFLEACSHNGRRNFRRWTRKLENRYPGQVRMITYSEENEVAEAIEIAAKISAETYQHAYGGGVTNDAGTRAFYRAAAKKGWLRIHLLFIGDEPCAFLTALKYDRIYLAELTGYSPKWKDLQVGNILFFKIVEQLCGDPVVDSFDHSFGEGQHKRWGDSRQWPEASVSIFAPRLFPVFVNQIQSSTLAISILTQHVITKLGIHNSVQRYRRKKILKKAQRVKGNQKPEGKHMQNKQQINEGRLNLSMRRTERQDINDLAVMSRICYPYSLRWQAPRFHIRKRWRLLLDSQCHEAWVCLSHGQIIGYFTLILDRQQHEEADARPHPGLFVGLYMLAVCPKLFITVALGKLKRRIQRSLTGASSDHDKTADSETLRLLDDRQVPWVGYVAVTPAMQGKGVATEMVKRCAQRARKVGFVVTEGIEYLMFVKQL